MTEDISTQRVRERYTGTPHDYQKFMYMVRAEAPRHDYLHHRVNGEYHFPGLLWLLNLVCQLVLFFTFSHFFVYCELCALADQFFLTYFMCVSYFSCFH